MPLPPRLEDRSWVLGKVHWNKSKEEGFTPVYKWKSITFEGSPRPFKAFLKGERMTVLRYFMCRISEHLFDSAPLKLRINQETGAFLFENDPGWDTLPHLIEDGEGWRMSDGSMEITKPAPEPVVRGMPDLAETSKEGHTEDPHNWPENSDTDTSLRACPKCDRPFTGSADRTECYECFTKVDPARD